MSRESVISLFQSPLVPAHGRASDRRPSTQAARADAVLVAVRKPVHIRVVTAVEGVGTRIKAIVVSAAVAFRVAVGVAGARARAVTGGIALIRLLLGCGKVFAHRGEI